MITRGQLPHNYNLLTPTFCALNNFTHQKIAWNWIQQAANVTHWMVEGFDLCGKLWDQGRKKTGNILTALFHPKAQEVDKVWGWKGRGGAWMSLGGVWMSRVPPVSPQRSALMDFVFPWKHTNGKFRLHHLFRQASSDDKEINCLWSINIICFWSIHNSHHLYIPASPLQPSLFSGFLWQNSNKNETYVCFPLCR